MDIFTARMRLLAPFLLCVMISTAVLFSRAGQGITAAVSWEARQDALVVPYINTTGAAVGFYVEASPVAMSVRVISVNGRVLKEFTDVRSILQCSNPTGAIITEENLKLLLFCSGPSVYYSATLDLESDVLRVISIRVGQNFIANSEKKPWPLVLKRGTSTGTPKDKAIALSHGASGYCIGMYGSSENAVVCQAEEIVDFFFSLPAVPTGDDPNPSTSLLVESKTSAGLRVDRYDVSTFADDVTPNATITVPAGRSSRVLRSNMDDTNSGQPLCAYTYASSGKTKQLKVVVVNAKTLAIHKQGSVDIEYTKGTFTVLSAYIVRVQFVSYLIVQLPRAIVSINFNEVQEGSSPLWSSTGEMVFANLLFLSYNPKPAWKKEVHRRQLSASYTDYNPYHVIESTHLGYISKSSNFVRLSLDNGSHVDNTNLVDPGENLCAEGDAVTAIRTTSMYSGAMYIGCENSGKYVLVLLSSPAAFYLIEIPSPKLLSGSTFGYSNGANSVTLTSGVGAAGFPLNPLLLYSKSVEVPVYNQFFASYYAGRLGILSMQKSGSPTFALYSFDVVDDILGMAPMEPMMTFDKFVDDKSQSPLTTPFIAYFGVGKRYVAVGVALGIVYVFRAGDGSVVKKLDLSGCFEGQDEPDVFLYFMKTVEHRGSKGDISHVLLGGTSSCVFEVNDTLSARYSFAVDDTEHAAVFTTGYNGYVLQDDGKQLVAYSNFFSENFGILYTIEDFDGYVAGVNVFVYIRESTITCRSILSDTIVWSKGLPSEYTGNVKYMTYYNNTVFVFDDKTYWRFDVQYRKDESKSSRIISSKQITKESTPIVTAKVDKGTIIALTSEKLYAFDAGDTTPLWEVPIISGLLTSSSEASIVMYSPEDTGGSNGDLGSAYVEVRIKSNTKRTVNIYSIADGSVITSVSGIPNDIAEHSIWKNTYLTHSSTALKLVALRSLDLSSVAVPEQVKRPPAPTSPVEVPGEPPLDPPEPQLPRGDMKMSKVPPMSVAALGDVALISEDRTHAVVANLNFTRAGASLMATCFNPSDPSGPAIRSWKLKDKIGAGTANFIPFDNEYFIIHQQNSLRFFSWSTCEVVGSKHSTGFNSFALPSFISLPSQKRWIFRSHSEVISVKLPNEGEEWSVSMGSCRFIKLVNNYVICHGGQKVAIINSGNGAVVRKDDLEGAVTSVGSNFMGVSRTGRGYFGVFYSSSGDVREVDIELPGSAGDVLSALPKDSQNSIIVVFEHLVASIKFVMSETPSVVVEWSNNMNGEVAELGAAEYLGDSKTSLAIGTHNGVILLRPSDGLVFSNISLPRRDWVEENEVHMFKVTSLSNDKYGVIYNGYSLVVHVDLSVPAGNAVFAFGGNRHQRATMLKQSENFILVSSGNMAGAVPVDAKMWGFPMQSSVYGIGGGKKYLAGYDSYYNPSVVLRTVSESNTYFRQTPESVIYDSAFDGGNAHFFGKKTISSIGPNEGKGTVFPLPKSCADHRFFSFYEGEGTGSMSLLLYSNFKTSKGCVFLLNPNGAPPTHLSLLDQAYHSAANVRNGDSFALVTKGDVLVYGYDGTLRHAARGIKAQTVSSISSPTTGHGIFVVTTADSLICYQVKGMLKVWSYSINISSRVPLTYYNESIFISTPYGPYRMLLEEFAYPCRDRMEFFLKPEGPGKSYSQVVVNAPYGIGYVLTRSVFYAFDTSTGKIIWKRPDLTSITDSKVLNKGKVLVVTSRQGAMFLNPFTGETLLYALNPSLSRTKIFSLDDTSVVFGGSMATMIKLEDYASYFAGVEPNRPMVSTPPYRPYNYNPSDKPNSCTKPGALPIMVRKGQEWIAGQRNIPSAPHIFHGSPYWAASFWKHKSGSQLVLVRSERGTLVDAADVLVDHGSCDGMNLFPVSETAAFVGLRCGGKTIFLDSTGDEVGTSELFAKNDISVAIGINGYFINKENRVDGVSLKTFQRLPRGVAQVVCSSDGFKLFAMSKSERIMLICPGDGIKMVQFAVLNQVGPTITPLKGSEFSSYDYSDKLSMCVACGLSGSKVYMKAFTSNAKILVEHTVEGSGNVMCAIVNHVGTEPLFALAYTDTLELWPVSGGNGTTYDLSNFYPVVLGGEGVIYTNGASDYFLKKYDDEHSQVVMEGLEKHTGSVAVRRKDTNLGKSAIVFGEGFAFAVDTSSGKVYWMGAGSQGNVYATSEPYAFAYKKGVGLRSYYMSSVQFSITGFVRVTPAEVNGSAVVFVSQPGSLGCLSADGVPLFNVGISSPDSSRIAFPPIVFEDHEYVIASGGGRWGALLNKNTGEIIAVFDFPACESSPDITGSTVIVNGTTAFITMKGWSCTFIVDVAAHTDSSTRFIDVIEVDDATNGFQPGSPIFARVGYANHLVYVAKDPEIKGHNIITVYRVSNRPRERTKLWSASIPCDSHTVSTYGYILYTSATGHVTASDLMTNTLAWGFDTKSEVLSQIVGADGYLYVTTLHGSLVFRSNINAPHNMRVVARLDFPNGTKVGKMISSTRTPYGQILFSDGTNAWAYQHLRSGKEFINLWSASGYSYIRSFFNGALSSMATVDTSRGSGILDLSCGEVRYTSDVTPSASVSSVGFAESPRDPPLHCSFSSITPNCRLLPSEFIEPVGKIKAYDYEPEPLEVVPPGWSPSVDGGHPTDFCMKIMEVHIPEYTSCMEKLIEDIYPHGRATAMNCPNDFVGVQKCINFLTPLIQDCPDVVSYIIAQYTPQTKDAESPVGLCDREEAKMRCNSSDIGVLEPSCVLVQMSLEVNGYQNPPGYDLRYTLPVFAFPVEEPEQNIGAIFGGIAGAVILIAILIGVYFFLRRKRKDRDARFFDDEDADVPFHNDFDKGSSQVDVPLMEMKSQSYARESDASEINLDSASQLSMAPAGGEPTVGPRKLPPKMPGGAPAFMPGKKGPKNPPPVGMQSIMDDDI